MPIADIEERECESGGNGTVVRIFGYRTDRLERSVNLDSLEDYIRWFTAAGSFKAKFADFPYLHREILNLAVAPQIYLSAPNENGEIIDKEIPGTHWFAMPNENPVPPEEEGVQRSDFYCKHFGPHQNRTTIDGEPVSVQVYGTVSGRKARESVCNLRQGETLKSRFGVYLCRDFIPFTKRNELIPSGQDFLHYHLLINCQSFDLTSDRNNLANEEDTAVQWALEEADAFIQRDVIPVAERTYFAMRREEADREQLSERRQLLEDRLTSFDTLSDMRRLSDNWPIKKLPNSEAQVAVILSAMLTDDRVRAELPDDLEIGTYSDQSPTDMICVNSEGDPVLVELEYNLSNIFSHGHALETFEYVICWNNDIPVGESREVAGKNLTLSRDGDSLFLSWGPARKIPVIALHEIYLRVSDD